MSSRYGAGRPRRDGETFARTHHHDNEQEDDSRVKFDVRNPSTLAPDAREDDAILDADVIGGGGAATKRGAVNLDGYDSDSDNDTFNARAESRKKGKVDINEQLDNYDNKATSGGPSTSKNDDDDDDDMFAAADGEGREDDENVEQASADNKKKKVQFMEANEIEGQDQKSKSGGTIHFDEEESSDAESEKELLAQEEGVDEEVGAGGLKRNAPKVEAFNLNDEMEEGRFDDQGNYVRKAGDPDAVHDSWLNGLSKRDMKKAAEAHEKRESEARKRRLEDDGLLSSDLLKTLILHLERAETPLEALARLGKGQKKTKKIPQWKLKKMNKGMDVDREAEQPDQEQERIKAAIDGITEAADKLLSRGLEDVYDQEREILVREYRKESGEDWVEPTREETEAGAMWEFHWVDGRDDGSTQGPFDGPTMKAWQDAGYFGQGIEFRPVGGSTEWSSETPSFI
ncbi:hypothetical protein V2A60_006629 [Cordyceps javanica]|uniref:GYF domain-containing protein n=1 Tax=Cordyceps javanica TaxID=43265 RepID=A0A545W5N5_9HYPO|nr:GYF domain-containing protein [Cordyceps javanica]TQW09195.1 GYF domain protein [Cordyceps javanica]